MNVIRLHGKIGDTQGIVHIRDCSGSHVWVVTLDTLDPNNVTKAKLLRPLS